MFAIENNYKGISPMKEAYKSKDGKFGVPIYKMIKVDLWFDNLSKLY